LVGSAAMMSVPVRSGNVLADPRYINVHPETRSELAVPLKNKRKVNGVVDLESTQTDYFTEYHERMLTTLASRIAAALVNAQLYARVFDNDRRMDGERK